MFEILFLNENESGNKKNINDCIFDINNKLIEDNIIRNI
jgi:hypothetical protein